MALSIRTRLALWFTTVLACGLVLLSILLYWGLKKSIESATDKELSAKLKAVAGLMQTNIPKLTLAELQEEFGERSSLGPDDLWQIQTVDGQPVFQSGPIQPYSKRVAEITSSAVPHRATIILNEKHKKVLRVMSGRVSVGTKEYAVQVAADLSEFVELLDALKWLSLITIPLTLLLASVGGYWLSSRALAPVLEITRETRTINSTNLSKRLSLPPNEDELRTLSLTLNDMLDRIESAFQRVQRFSADASHELRTPISVIRATAELALRKQRDPQSYRDALLEVLRESERTSGMIENLLSLARSDASPRLPLTQVDIAGIVLACHEQIVPIASQKGITNALDVPSAPALTLGNAEALHRLFLILLDNAIKYSSEQGRITTSLAKLDGEIAVTIEDTGIGIAEDVLPHIFERFYRADKARSRDLGGAGLGLSIAKWIADAHHAEIQVTSTLGHGSAFRVVIPIPTLL